MTGETTRTQTKTEAEAPRLEERLGRIEAIVERLEGDDLELEAALELFEEGIVHVREVERILSDAELRIERLVEDESGRTRVEAMERDEA